MPENDSTNQPDVAADGRPKSVAPPTVYETCEMTIEQIEAQNATYASMGLNIVIIDVSKFSAKLEPQPDGTLKRTLIRKPRKSKS
jgi:hypothetical protein